MRLTARQQLEFGREWVDKNPETWRTLKVRVLYDAAMGKRQPFRLSYYVEGLRASGMSFRNTAAPYVVRRLERETGATFAKSKSRIDPLFEAEEREEV